MLKKAPVIVSLTDNQISQYSLQKDLRIDRTDLDRELARQPILYNQWSEFYATVSARVSKLREELAHLEAQLHSQYSDSRTITERKHRILLNPLYRKKLKRLRHWEDSERYLHFAEKSFAQRMSMLMCANSNQRRERQNLE
jgi:hypothetical protein